MIYEYLKRRGAYGKENAVKTAEIRESLHCNARMIDFLVFSERKAGQLIISKTTDGGGYYLPATREEVLAFVRQQEGRIKKHAVTLRAARAFLKNHAAAIKRGVD